MDTHRATWTPSSVRRNCDLCVKKKVKCPGDRDGRGCLFCQKKGVRCNYSVKQKRGPKRRKRGVQDLGPATEATEAPKDSSMPQRQQQHPLATGTAGTKGGFDTGDGYAYAGGVGGENGSFLMASSPPSTAHLRPPKRPGTMHDEGYRSVRQQSDREHKRQNIPLQSKPAPLTQWLWGSGEDDSHLASVHPGGGAPLTPLSCGLSPTSWTSASHRASGDDPLGGARLGSSAGTFEAQRASSGDDQLLKTAIEPGGNLDGAGGLSGNGGSFVFSLKGEELNMEKLLGMLNPLNSLIDEEVSGGSDASSNRSAADDNEMARTGAFLRSQKSGAGGRSEILPEMGVVQGVRSRQIASLSSGAPSGGGVGSGRGVRNDSSLDDPEVPLTLLPELGSEDGEGFCGRAGDGSHLEHPSPAAAFPLAGNDSVDSASERRAMSEHAGTGFATSSNRGSSSHQLGGGGSEGYSSLFDPFAQSVSQGQLIQGDWSGTDNVMNEYLYF